MDLIITVTILLLIIQSSGLNMNSWQWKIKTFRTIEAMNEFLYKNDRLIEFNEVYVNNAYAIEYRKLRIVY